MITRKSVANMLELESVIDRNVAVARIETSIVEAIALMSQRDIKCELSFDLVPSLEELKWNSKKAKVRKQSRANTCITSNDPSIHNDTSNRNSCILVTEKDKLVGILTERDVLKLIASQKELKNLTVADIVNRELITLKQSENVSILTALFLLNRHQIRHLPILDERENLRGLITSSHILRAKNLLKMQTIGETMTTNVINTLPTASVLSLARMMEAHEVSYAIVVEELEKETKDTSMVRPVGIITQGDIVQSQVLELDLSKIQAKEIMSSPVFTLKPEDFLWVARAEMQKRKISHLVITGDLGQLRGIITESNLIQAIDPSYISDEMENLQQQIEEKNQVLEQEITKRQQLEDELKQLKQQLEIIQQERIDAIDSLNDRWQQGNEAFYVQQKIDDFIDNSVLGMHWVASDGTILWANQTELNLLGYSKEEYIGHSIVEFYVDRAVIDELLRRLSNNETVRDYEAQLKCKDGSICHVLIDSNVSWQNGKFANTRCFTRDVSERHQAEESRRKAEQKLQKTLRSLEFQKYALDRAAIVAITDSHGVITYVNDRFCQISKYSREELIGKTHQIINSSYHPPEFFKKLWKTIASGNVWQGEIKNKTKDGHFYWVETTIVPFIDETGKPFQYLSIRFDISERKRSEAERKQVEEALRQSEQKFRAIFDGTFGFIGLLNSEGILLEANRAALEAIDVELADVRGQPFWQTPWWSHSPQLQEKLRQAIALAANGELICFEAEHILANGSSIFVDFSLKPVFDDKGKVVMLIPEGRDISERKQAEQKIRQQAALLDVTTDAIVVRDLQSQIKFWNKGAEKIYGWQATEAIGRDARSLLYGTVSTEAETAYATVLKQGEWQGELHKITKTAKEAIVASRWTSIADESGNPKFILSVDTDITDKKLLEAQFLRAQRLESLGTLASGIAHDMNNVLTPILGIAQLLPLKLPNLEPQNQRLLQILRESAMRGANLVQQILSFARGAEGEKTSIQLAHILQELVKVARQTFPKSIEISLTLPNELWLVSGDATQLHQVLMNLCVNARDALPKGGKLEIIAENLYLDESYTRIHLDAKVGFYVVVTVTDNGIGISPENIERIFEPFFTTKESGKGTGLGLSTVIGIIKSHQGFVRVYSEIGKGTSFKIYLPAEGNIETIESIQRDLESIEGNEELILVVDDEASVREITRSALENYHYHVLTASDGVEAIALYAQHKDEIAVVLLDLMMPSLDTPSIIRTLERINPQIQIIAMSGLSSNEQITNTNYASVRTFLAKPFTTQNLLKTLSETLGRQ
jgi:PAS domain S-box-containing protein